MPRAAVVLAMLAVFFGAVPASAEECQEEEILIQFAGNVFGREGEVIQVAQVAVHGHLVGATCTGTATVENNSSAHPGNDFIIISSGGTTVEIADFERIAGKVTTTTSRLVLGESITASIRLGPHGVASLAGDTVVVATLCQPPPTTTTTQPPATTTTTQPPIATTTTQPPVTTTTETPIGGVSAGGGGVSQHGGAGVDEHSGVGVALLGVGALALLGAVGLAGRGLRLTRR